MEEGQEYWAMKQKGPFNLFSQRLKPTVTLHPNRKTSLSTKGEKTWNLGGKRVTKDVI